MILFSKITPIQILIHASLFTCHLKADTFITQCLSFNSHFLLFPDDKIKRPPFLQQTRIKSVKVEIVAGVIREKKTVSTEIFYCEPTKQKFISSTKKRNSFVF